MECSKAGEHLKAEDDTRSISILTLATLQDNNGNTPLHTAASHGHLAATKYLAKETWSNVTCTNHDGGTPLHLQFTITTVYTEQAQLVGSH